MGDAIKTLFTSKKTWVALATALVWIVAQFGLNLPEQEVRDAVLVFAALFVGLVAQDWGKGDVAPKTVGQVLVEFANSKKAMVVVGTMIAWVVTRVGLHVSAETIGWVLNGGSILILGFAGQDAQKEKAKLEAAEKEQRLAVLAEAVSKKPAKKK